MALNLFLLSRASGVFGLQLFASAFIFRVVESGGGPAELGWLALAAVGVSLISAWPLGRWVDLLDRRAAVLGSHLALVGFSVVILLADPQSLSTLVGSTAILAVGRSFRSISQFAVLGELLRHHPNPSRGVNLSTLSWQLAAFAAPLAAGLLGSGQLTLFLGVICFALAFFCQLQIVKRLKPTPPKAATEGLWAFLVGNRRLRGALTLDFVVVVFAGASTLLPFLHAAHSDAFHIGLLRSALPAGVILGTVVAIGRAWHERWAGFLLLATTGFGLCHLALAESPSLMVSYALLVGAGVFDAISLSVRECLLQLETPAPLKGRVSALNGFLAGASDELSEWESGLAASWVGVRPALRLSGGLALAACATFAIYVKTSTTETRHARDPDFA